MYKENNVAIINEILLKEIRNYDLDATEDQMADSIAAAAGNFNDWDAVPSIVAHAMVILAHLSLLTPDVATAVEAEDWDAATTAVNAIDGDAETLAYIVERIQLHVSEAIETSSVGDPEEPEPAE